MADIIEFGLDKYTDFRKFEMLATEVLTFEGFCNIMPIGGIDDEGVDAETVKYFQDKEQRTVFQYTIQENLSSKVSDTIKKLKANNVEFQQVIFVTKHQINNIATIKRTARTKHQVSIDIFEKKTFIKHLSTQNGLFARYFPDIKAQLTSSLLDTHTVFSSNDSQDPLESSLLRCSLLFTFNSNSDGARKDLFDSTILALISTDLEPKSIEFISQRFKDQFGKEITGHEIDSSIVRLKKKKLVSTSNNKITATELAVERLEGNQSRINSETKALIDDINAKVSLIHEDKIDTRTEGIITNNIQQSLSAYFCLYGLEYTDSAQTLGAKFGFSQNQDLIEIAKNGLPERIGDLLVYSIGETLKEPTIEQTEILAGWARAYIGVQIMGLDPKLRNIQATHLNKKTFIIDTDFLLYCLVSDTSLNSIYLRVVEELRKLSCRIIIPEEVIYEALKHAEFSERNYNYFRNTFDTVDSAIIDEKIGNIFVKGYYSAITNRNLESSDSNFKTYLANFYDKEYPFEFLKEVIERTFKGNIEIKEISELIFTPIEPYKLEELTNAIYEETQRTFKGTYRSRPENLKVAQTDAKLYLTLHNINQSTDRNSKEIFSGTHYLLTSTTRALRCARKLGYKHNVLAKPNTLINLLERIGKFHPSAKDIVNLFENPFLIDAVNNSWDDIKNLIEAGVSLKGKNIVRLKWDLDKEIKTFISNQQNVEEPVENISNDKVVNYISFIKDVKSKGYKLIPETEQLYNKFEDFEDQIQSNKITQEALGKEIEKFGAKRQKYFNKIKKKK